MNRKLLAICIGTVAIALGASGQTSDQATTGTTGKKARSASTNATVRSSARTSGGVRGGSNQHFQTRANTVGTRTNTAAVRSNNNVTTRTHVGDRNLRRNTTTRQDVAADRVNNLNNVNGERAARFNRTDRVNRNNDLAVNRDRNVTVNRDRNVTLNRQRNVTTINRERNINRTRNVTVVNNWRSSRFSGANYAAFRNYHREWHDRSWWRSHYNRLIFVSGGWYYWNSGFWYPAWGYDSGYSYPYDGPIYGARDLTPDQVIVSVQEQLQRDGYYTGPIDGILGVETRQGIAAFQADNGLAVTSAIDEPTLATLGLV